jgi:hypothetical protein
LIITIGNGREGMQIIVFGMAAPTAAINDFHLVYA